MKKTVVIVALAIVAVIGVMLWGRARTAEPTEAQRAAPSALAATTPLYDFGTISMANGDVNHVFQVTNPTARDITVTNVETSCMCTTAYLVNGNTRKGPFGMPGMGGINATDSVIPAHGTQDVDIVFDPAAHGPAGVGNIDRRIYLTAADGGTLQLEIKAVVTP